HYPRPGTDESGALRPNVQVTLFLPGTTTPISDVVYSTDTGNNVLTNPFVSGTGVVDFYLDSPKRVRLAVIQGNTPVQYYEDVDVLAAGSDSPHTGAGTNSIMIGVGATSAGNNSTVVGQGANSAGAGGSAFGTNAAATGSGSVAVGSAAVQGVSAIGIGAGSQAPGDHSVAVGDGSTA